MNAATKPRAGNPAIESPSYPLEQFAPLPIKRDPTPDPYAVRPNAPIQSEFDYLARGGMTQSVLRSQDAIEEQRQERAMRRMYEEIISRGERGAMALYDDAMAAYGDEVKAYIPPPAAFRNEKGGFSPVEYTKSVYIGLQKYKESKAELEKDELERTQFQSIAPVLQNAQSARDASSGIAAQGLDPSKFGSVYSQFPDELDQQKARAEIDNLRARTQSVRSGGSDDPALKAATTQAEKDRKDKFLIESKIREVQSKKATALKDQVFDTTIYDEQLSQLETSLQTANTRVKLSTRALDKLVEQGGSEYRQAIKDATVGESESRLDELHGIYGTPREKVDAARGNYDRVIQPIQRQFEREITPPGDVGTPLPQDKASAKEYIRSRAEQLTDSPIAANKVTSAMFNLPDSSETGEGDSDVLSVLQQPENAALWRKYQQADPMTQAKYRATVRKALNETTR